MDLSQFMQMPHFLFEKPSENSGGEGNPEDGTGDDDVEDAGKPTFTPEQQKFIDGLIGNTRKAEREKARKEAEARAQQEKEEVDKKKLEEQGEFKKLADAAEKKAAEEKARADQAIAETNKLKLQRKFEEAVAETGIKFVNSKAAEDAFAHLATESIGEGEDYKGLDEAVKKLIEERDYLFGDEVKIQDIDAVTKTKVNNKQVSQRDLLNKKKSTGRYSAI